MKKLNRLAIADGIARILALKLITELSSSTYLIGVNDVLISWLLYAVLAFAVPAGFFLGHSKTIRLNVNRYFLISFISFIIFLFIVIINSFTVDIRVFPRRELYDADGVAFVLGTQIFFAVNLICRFTGYAVLRFRSDKEAKQ